MGNGKATRPGPPPTASDVLAWLAEHRARNGPTSPRDIPQRLRVPEILEALVLDGRIECRRYRQQLEERDRKIPVGRLPTLQELLAAGRKFRVVKAGWERCHPEGLALASGKAQVQLFLSIEARRERIGGKATEAAEDVPALTQDQLAILEHLRGIRGPVHIADLAKRLRRSARRLAPKIRELEGLGLVEFPKGDRGGCQITSAGREAIAPDARRVGA